MSISKPTCPEELFPPFEKIGDNGWNKHLSDFLKSFDVPLPDPCTNLDLEKQEQAMGMTFPDSLRTFLLEFGPVSFDYIEILAPSQISLATELWFADKLTENLNEYILIANAGGPENQFALNIESGDCYLARHYPPRLERCLNSFDDLIRIACVGLFTGYYGWDDEELEAMQTQVMKDLFGFVL